MRQGRRLEVSLLIVIASIAASGSARAAQWTPGTSAPAGLAPRQGHAMAYDAARSRVVLFGGRGTALRNDTWELAGSGWTQGPAAPAGLTPRELHGMAFDSARGVVVIFGGNDGTLRNDVWEYDGTTFVAGAAAPGALTPRSGHAMAFHAGIARTVVFGGNDGALRDDTWLYDGTTWSAGPAAPGQLSARELTGMAYDSGRGRIVLFGGRATNGRRRDTWEMDGSQWLAGPNPPNALKARFAHALAYDAALGRTVLFGGCTNNNCNSRRNDTWEYDGTAWLPQAAAPGALTRRRGHAMAHDVARLATVLVGGFDGNVRNDVWEYRCVLSVSPQTLPQATEGQAYTQTLIATGGTPPYLFSVTSGALPPGLTLAPTGTITGTPTIDGIFTFTVSVSDVGPCRGSIVYTLVVNPPGCGTLSITPPLLPDGVEGQAYSQQLAGAGGTPPYTFSLSSGILPPGLTLSSSGLIAGTATTQGSYGFIVGITDAAGCSGTQSFLITVNPPGCGTIVIDPPTLPAGTVGTPYAATLTASGGSAPYDFSLASGSLPPGLTLFNTGDITGTPLLAGLYSFVVVATDDVGCSGSQAYDILVNGAGCGNITISPATLPAGTQGQSYSQQLTATGGAAPYTYALGAGSLPPGLTLSAGGLISGVPAVPGLYPFTVVATDTAGCSGSISYDLQIDPGSCPTITVGPPGLPNGTVGTPYSQQLSASGGTAPYTFALASGALPAGLTLSSGGLISGTPTTPGSYSFTVSATDATACAGTASYTIIVSPTGCPAIVLSPPTLPDGSAGVPYSQTLTASGGTPPYTFTLTGGALPPGLVLSPVGDITGTPTTAGLSLFTVTAFDATFCAGSRAYGITIAAQVNYVAGEGFGFPNPNRVVVRDASGIATAFDVLAYGAGRWGVAVAAGDIDGAIFAEVVTGPGPGDVFGPQIRAFRRDGTPVSKVNFFAYGTLKYGANASSDNLDGDTFAEIATGAGPGDVFGPHVRGWNFDATAVSAIAKINFFAYGTLKYGVNEALRSVDGDPFVEILTGPGPGIIFGPQVRGFNYDATTLTAISKINFNAFTPLQYGANVAGGDADADGFAEILAARGPGASLASEYQGFNYDGTTVSSIAGLGGVPFTTLYGLRVGSGDLSLDGRWDVVVGPGPAPAALSTVEGYSFDGTSTSLLASFVPFGTNTYGSNVAAGELGY